METINIWKNGISREMGIRTELVVGNESVNSRNTRVNSKGTKIYPQTKEKISLEGNVHEEWKGNCF